MKGGTITGFSKAGDYGVYNAGTMNVSGNAKIIGNSPSNVYITNASNFHQTDDLNASSIGVTVGTTDPEAGGIFGVADNKEFTGANCFFADASVLTDTPLVGKNENGSLKWQPVVASVTTTAGTTYHDTLSDAVDACPTDGTPATITLLTDITTDDIDINGGRNITLNLENFTLKSPDYSSSPVIDIYSGASLTLTAETGGKITQGDNSHPGEGGAIYNSGHLTLTGKVTITGCSAVSGGAVYNTGTVIMESGTITGCSAKDGGAVYVTGGTLTLDDTAKITGCSAAQNGGAVYLKNTDSNNALFEMKGGTIGGADTNACTANGTGDFSGGGAVYVDYNSNTSKTSSFKMTGGLITGCTATGTGEYSGGGAIYNKSGKVTYNPDTEKLTVTFWGIDVTGGTIKGCSAKDGGAIYNGVTAKISSLTIGGTADADACTAGNGGAIYNTGDKLEMTNCTIQNCSASGSGGAIYHRNSAITLTGLTIKGCTAGNGGAIYNTGGNKNNYGITINGGSITGCKATSVDNPDGGGAIYNNNSQKDYRGLLIDGTTFTDCSVTVYDKSSTDDGGGAIYNYCGTVTLSDITIDGSGLPEGTDTNAYNGGAIYNNSNLTIEGGTIRNCSAGDGGAIKNNENLTINGITIENCHAKGSSTETGNGGGICSQDTDNNTPLTLTGAVTIRNCTATGNGGGIYHVLDEGYTDTLQISGTPVITGNTSTGASGDADNLYVSTHTSIPQIMTGPLTDGASVGISGEATPAAGSLFGEATGSYTGADKFFADSNPDLKGLIVKNDTKYELRWAASSVTTGTGKPVRYSTLNDAVAACPTGGTPATLTLLADCTVNLNPSTTEEITIPAGKNITLDLNGKTLTKDRAGYFIKIEGGAALTIKDTTADKEGIITRTPTEDGQTYFSAITNNGTLTLESGTIKKFDKTEDGGAVMNAGTFTMKGGKITECAANCGGAVHNQTNSTFTMEGGEISACVSTGDGETDGGGAVCNTGTFTMTGGKITGDCRAVSGNGGAVYNTGSFTMTKGSSAMAGNSSAPEISSCYAAGSGGAVYNDKGTFTLSTGEINGCTAGNNGTPAFGAGVYNTGTFNLSAGEITGCVVMDTPSGCNYGAGIYNDGTLKVSGAPDVSGNQTKLTSGTDVDDNICLGGSGSITLAGDLTAGIELLYKDTAATAGTAFGTAEKDAGGKFYSGAGLISCMGQDAEGQPVKLIGSIPEDSTSLVWKSAKIARPEADATVFTYTGEEQTYSPKGFDADAMSISGEKMTNAGSSTVTVTLKDGFTWEDGATDAVTFNFTVSPCAITDDAVTIAGIPDQAWTGEAVTPEPVLTFGSTVMVKDTDYTLSYENNVDPGTATVNVTGTGNFKDSRDVQFTIQEAMYKVTVTAGAGGKAAASPESAAAGTKITLTATPDAGYQFKEWQSADVAEITDNSFVMPAKDVTITAVFDGSASAADVSDGGGSPSNPFVKAAVDKGFIGDYGRDLTKDVDNWPTADAADAYTFTVGTVDAEGANGTVQVQVAAYRAAEAGWGDHDFKVYLDKEDVLTPLKTVYSGNRNGNWQYTAYYTASGGIDTFVFKPETGGAGDKPAATAQPTVKPTENPAAQPVVGQTVAPVAEPTAAPAKAADAPAAEPTAAAASPAPVFGAVLGALGALLIFRRK